MDNVILGHVLKGVVQIFIYLSMKFAIYMSETVVGRQSCHQMNLFQVIKKDLQPRGLYLNNLDDLNRLREVAFDKAQWRAKFLYTVPIGAIVISKDNATRIEYKSARFEQWGLRPHCSGADAAPVTA